MALLSEALRSDVDADVRLAAAEALGETKNPAAVAALGEALSDSDPAMQYRAVLSLQQATGKDFGTSVERWQQYVKQQRPQGAELFVGRIAIEAYSDATSSNNLLNHVCVAVASNRTSP